MSRAAKGHRRILDRLRKLCLGLPESSEVEAWGHPTFRVRGKIFASFGSEDDRPVIGVKSTLPEQQVLVQDPRFFVPKYVGVHGWVGIRADGKLDWDVVEELVLESFRHVAPKRLVQELDG